MQERDTLQFGWFHKLLTRYVEGGKDTRLKELVNDYLLPVFIEEAPASPMRASGKVLWAIMVFYPRVFLSTSFYLLKEFYVGIRQRRLQRPQSEIRDDFEEE